MSEPEAIDDVEIRESMRIIQQKKSRSVLIAVVLLVIGAGGVAAAVHFSKDPNAGKAPPKPPTPDQHGY